MQRFKWLAMLSQTAIVLGLFLVTGTVQAQDVGTNKDVPGKEAPAAGQPESRRRSEATVIVPQRRSWGVEPYLLREIRNEQFAAKIKLTDEQTARLNELNSEFLNAIRELARAGGTPQEVTNRRQEMSTYAKACEAKALDVLTPEQKVIWEAYKQAVIAAVSGGPETQDKARIRALEVEVESLKAEVAKLKVAIEAKPATRAP